MSGLLQIAEPGMSEAPHQYRLAIGIDLGTTHSLVAAVWQNKMTVFPDETGHVLLPSVVRYVANEKPIVGAKARDNQVSHPESTISSVKRLMGKNYDEAVQCFHGQNQLIDEGKIVRIKTDAGLKTPIDVSSDILRTLKERVREQLSEEIAGAVITVPAYFDETQRQATKDAAQLAGLYVLRLLAEPTAAAVAYGLDYEKPGTYVAYDLGGGTFDVSVLKLKQGVFEVLATGGNTLLGGDDFDEILKSYMIEQGALTSLTKQDYQQLLHRARSVKEAFSQAGEVDVHELLQNNQPLHITIKRETFFELTQTLVDQTMSIVEQTLKDAKLEKGDIDGVILIGGSTRLLSVKKALKDYFKCSLYDSINPDEVVAIGAAKQANLLAGNRLENEDWLLLDVIPLSLGIETMGGLVEKIIPRNATIPCTYAQDFTTFKDGQTSLSVHVLQGERDLVEHCRSLARFELRGIAPQVAGVARIRITFHVDADGLLCVTAQDLSTNVQTQVVVKPSYGLTDEEVAQRLREASSLGNEDKLSRVLREETVEAMRLIQAMNTALSEDSDLLSIDELKMLKEDVALLQDAIDKQDLSQIKEQTKQLSTASASFAARRMDRAIFKALSGQSVDEIKEKTCQN